MSLIAIVGSGALGGAIAHTLATRDRTAEIRLIDSAVSVARGKALDIRQAGAISGFHTHLDGTDDFSRITGCGVCVIADRFGQDDGADVVVIADAAAGDGEHAGEPGLALLRRLIHAGNAAPVLCAGAAQRQLIARAVGDGVVRPARR